MLTVDTCGGRIGWHSCLRETTCRPYTCRGRSLNQGCLYDRFDAVVLLSAPAKVHSAASRDRESNSYGKSPQQRELVLRHLVEVEPLLRRT